MLETLYRVESWRRPLSADMATARRERKKRGQLSRPDAGRQPSQEKGKKEKKRGNRKEYKDIRGIALQIREPTSERNSCRKEKTRGPEKRSRVFSVKGVGIRIVPKSRFRWREVCLDHRIGLVWDVLRAALSLVPLGAALVHSRSRPLGQTKARGRHPYLAGRT